MLARTEVPDVVTFALFQDPAGNLLGLAEFGSYPTEMRQCDHRRVFAAR